MTLKKIALLAGVSPSTVSKALQNSHEISDETTARVRAVAEETGYFEQRKRRRFAESKKNAPNVAILCCEIVSTYYAHAVSCLCREIEALGGTAIVALYDFDQAKLRALAKKYASMEGISGILCVPGTGDLRGLAVPCVSVLQAIPGVDSVYIDNDAALQDAIDFLVAQGRTKLAFLSETLSSRFGQAATGMLAAHGLEPAMLHISQSRFESAGMDGVETMLRQGVAVDAILAAYDEIAIGAIHALRCYGLRVPEDVFVVGINDIQSASHCTPPLSSIHCSVEEACHAGLELLTSRLNDPAVRSARQIAFQGRLILRETTCGDTAHGG
ncbi:MAG: LacI family DNA-binding transcriptional regulator [Oscillospiraceae bacterium]|nr:LacI family DNA-binding transcriptional regulator [Oscillospiraceae bacterium]